MQISKATAKDMIQKSKGKIFTTTYIKKDKSKRVMNCRLHVQKGVTGEGLKYNPDDYNLIPVYDMQVKGFRMVNVATLVSLSISNETYEVV
jgi:hypothetical protein